MARPKTFDRDEVLERAMQLFWSRGYERTSIQDLVDAMGINRGSLYDTFGDKENLYFEALDRYRTNESRQGLSRVVAEIASPSEAIETYFRRVIEGGGKRQGKRGCFVSNTVSEFGTANNRIAESARSAVRDIEAIFTRLIERGQAEGTFRRDQTAEAMAAFLATALNGLRVMVKANERADRLEEVLELTMGALSAPPAQ